MKCLSFVAAASAACLLIAGCSKPQPLADPSGGSTSKKAGVSVEGGGEAPPPTASATTSTPQENGTPAPAEAAAPKLDANGQLDLKAEFKGGAIALAPPGATESSPVNGPLSTAFKAYYLQFRRPPGDWNDLVTSGVIQALPKPPDGMKFAVDPVTKMVVEIRK